MDSGLVTALSGAIAQSKRLEKIANNLANADTPGFKSEDLVFQETLESAHRNDDRSDIGERSLTEYELTNQAGKEVRPVLYGEDFTDMKGGGLKETGLTLDFAIEGNGFFEVLTPQGVRLTRAGNFTLDGSGQLVTHEGFPVLGPGTGTDPAQAAARALRVGTTAVTVDSDGSIYGRAQNGEAAPMLGQLSMVQVSNPRGLKKMGQNTFEAGPDAGVIAPGAMARAPANAVPANAPNAVPAKPNSLGNLNQRPRVRQGVLETSNVNPVQEMTRMIEAQRLFEQNVKLMQTFGDMSNRASEIGKF